VPFEATLVRYPGPAARVAVPVPEEHAPPAAGPFGRTPVLAVVDGVGWATSAWRDRAGGWVLPVPARVRRGEDDGDVVTVEITVDAGRTGRWCGVRAPRRRSTTGRCDR
jgi:hypothetical protein